MIRKMFVLVIATMLFSSCYQDEVNVDKTPYFKFTNEDILKLVKPEIIGTKLKYKNQLGVEREFDIFKCSVVRDSYGFSSFWGSSYIPDYYYDTQETEARFSDENGSISLRIYFQTVPQNMNINVLPYTFTNPKFSGSIDFSIYNKNCDGSWNTSCGRSSFDESNLLVEPMVINGKEYRDVRVFASNSTNSFPSGNQNNIYGQTVNKIYYSYDYCMIGFDEVDGTLWRIVN